MSNRRGRKKRDEPFNPFAPSASAQRNQRQTERKNMERRSPQTRPNPSDSKASSGMSELAKKQKEAMERMKRQQGGATKPQTNSVAKAPAPKPHVSNEDRLAELRRKSELSRQNAKSRKESSDNAMRVTKFCSKHPDARTIIQSMEPLLEKILIPPIGTDFAARWNVVELAIKGSGSSKQEEREDRLTEPRRKPEDSRANAKQNQNPHTVETHIEPNSNQHLNKSSPPASKTRKNVFKHVPTVQSKPRQSGKSNSKRNRRNEKNPQNKAKSEPKRKKKPVRRTQSKPDKTVIKRAKTTVPKISGHRWDMGPERRKEIIENLRPDNQRKKQFVALEECDKKIRKLERKAEPQHDEIKRLRLDFEKNLRYFNR